MPVRNRRAAAFSAPRATVEGKTFNRFDFLATVAPKITLNVAGIETDVLSFDKALEKIAKDANGFRGPFEEDRRCSAISSRLKPTSCASVM
jgi:hypothetical protein